MTAQSEIHSGHFASGGGAGAATGSGGQSNACGTSQVEGEGHDAGDPAVAAVDELLLSTLLDGMDAALCAFDAAGAVTHWNREAERLLGWSRQEAVGRQGLSGWAALPADTADMESRLFDVRDGPHRQVHELPLLTKDGGRVLVRAQVARVSGPADGPADDSAGVYCVFSRVHAQVDLERTVALSTALFEDASWGVVLVDADLRPAAVNAPAERLLRGSRAHLLGRPLGELLAYGAEELEGALQHVLAQHGEPPGPTEVWVTLRASRPGGDARDLASTGGDASPTEAGEDGADRRCWRSGFLRLGSPLADAPVPLGVAWLFQDVTEAKRAEQRFARQRFRDNQLHRAARAASECGDPMEAATVHLDFALAGFADHALLDLTLPGERPDGATRGSCVPLVRAVATPAPAPGSIPPAGPELWSRLPVGYGVGHPAVQAYESGSSVRTSVGGVSPSVAAAIGGRQSAGGSPVGTARWAAARKWPQETVHGLCVVLRSRGRTLGVATFLRGAHRCRFDRSDAAYAEDVAVRVAAMVDLARRLPRD